jgi:transcriptional regulator with XRE-family HTH domain
MSRAIGEKIKELRNQEGLGQAEFSELVDIPRITLQNYERGVSKVTEVNLLKITNNPRFKKYALWLVCDQSNDVSQEMPAPTANEFEQLLQSMSGDEVEQLVQYMEFLVAKRKG